MLNFFSSFLFIFRSNGKIIAVPLVASAKIGHMLKTKMVEMEKGRKGKVGKGERRTRGRIIMNKRWIWRMSTKKWMRKMQDR